MPSLQGLVGETTISASPHMIPTGNPRSPLALCLNFWDKYLRIHSLTHSLNNFISHQSKKTRFSVSYHSIIGHGNSTAICQWVTKIFTTLCTIARCSQRKDLTRQFSPNAITTESGKLNWVQRLNKLLHSLPGRQFKQSNNYQSF